MMDAQIEVGREPESELHSMLYNLMTPLLREIDPHGFYHMALASVAARIAIRAYPFGDAPADFVETVKKIASEFVALKIDEHHGDQKDIELSAMLIDGWFNVHYKALVNEIDARTVIT